MKKMLRLVVTLVILVILAIGIYLTWTHKKDIGECTQYQCDVKNFRLSTTIEIQKEKEDFAKIKGNIFRFVTDPLTMYDLEDNKIAYADDTYHFISQDSHCIYVNGTLIAEMVGKVKFFGEAYEIYNKEGDKIGKVTFNYFNTNGEMYDQEGKLIADYNSKLLFKDFEVRIVEDCMLDENTVLMIFCSYYSDQAEDAKVANSSSSKKSS